MQLAINLLNGPFNVDYSSGSPDEIDVTCIFSTKKTPATPSKNRVPALYFLAVNGTMSLSEGPAGIRSGFYFYG